MENQELIYRQKIFLDRAVSVLANGNKSELARILDIPRSNVTRWFRELDKNIPIKHAKKIEELTNGLITIEQLVPDYEPPKEKIVCGFDEFDHIIKTATEKGYDIDIKATISLRLPRTT